jgi:Fe-S cluster assembly scaffold protein SufB
MVIQDLVTSLRLQSRVFTLLDGSKSSVLLSNGVFVLSNPNSKAIEIHTEPGSECELFIVLEEVSGEVTLDISVQVNSDITVSMLVLNTTQHSLRVITKLNHSFENSSSKCMVRSVLGGNSHMDFLGVIHVSQIAVRTNAYLHHKTLLLDELSSVVTKPELVIKNDDVSCSHGATVSNVDEDITQYLSSRGLTKKQITDLQVETFFKEVWQK